MVEKANPPPSKDSKDKKTIKTKRKSFEFELDDGLAAILGTSFLLPSTSSLTPLLLLSPLPFFSLAALNLSLYTNFFSFSFPQKNTTRSSSLWLHTCLAISLQKMSKWYEEGGRGRTRILHSRFSLLVSIFLHSKHHIHLSNFFFLLLLFSSSGRTTVERNGIHLQPRNERKQMIGSNIQKVKCKINYSSYHPKNKLL